MRILLRFRMLRKSTQSTTEQLHAANAEVLRLQQQLKREAEAASQSHNHAISKTDKSVSSRPQRNPLRQAFVITAAFAVFWLVATRSIKSGLPPTVFDSIAAGDAAAVAEWALRTPLEEQMAVSKREQWAALHAAAHSGHDGIVQILLQAGHDVNACDMHKATPLHRAAASGSLQTVSLLLKAGAKTDNLDKFGANAYGWAVKYGHTHLLQVLQPEAAKTE